MLKQNILEQNIIKQTQTLNRKHAADEENVYLYSLAHDAWTDINAYHIANKAAWRRVAILAITALLIISIAAIYIVDQDKHKVVVFEKDSLGNISTLGLAQETFTIDNKIIAHQLANYFIALREVPKDMSQRKRNIDLIHKMTDTAFMGQVDNMLISQYTKAHDSFIEVNLNQIKPLANGKSWLVGWSEQELDNEAANSRITNYSSVVTFVRQDKISPQIQIVNPTGLFITYLHPTEDINDK